MEIIDCFGYALFKLDKFFQVKVIEISFMLIEGPRVRVDNRKLIFKITFISNFSEVQVITVT